VEENDVTTDIVPPTTEALREALNLSAEVLRNIELSEIPLTRIALKASRLARLLNDYDTQKIMEFEAGGYPSTPKGIPPDIWRLADIAGRTREVKDKETGEVMVFAHVQPIAEWEQIVNTAAKLIEAAREPDVSLVSANPSQYIFPPQGHALERQIIRTDASTAATRIAERRSFIYSYALRKHYELKFSGIADDIFSRTRERVDSCIGKYIPEAVQKLSAIHDNLRSENAEDWSNAVHGCRRILQDLADAIFPPQKEDRITKTEKGETLTIKLGKGQYINRLMAFIEEHSSSKRFKQIVGSHLSFIGERLDSIVEAAQKGTHDIIVSPQEADRYVIYTYMVVGDILSLLEDATEK
jgi:hypothetical protein